MVFLLLSLLFLRYSHSGASPDPVTVRSKVRFILPFKTALVPCLVLLAACCQAGYLASHVSHAAAVHVPVAAMVSRGGHIVHRPVGTVV
ncbi:hypothetical protein HPB47_021614 [Ixodes persulcatus]|uniref:Uncharacterized protein n=1 Tax=Ixodes persulcatus TaxID=34615 RepID=A0AC60QC80_IXOPE|nr:hypothetical protein HPB47_021614 [Ixodes persulcatus]